jgi:iron(III) transport system permease protein
MAKGELLNSFAVSALAATLFVLLTVPLSYQSSRLAPRRRARLSLLYFLPAMFPGVLIGIGLVALWNRPGLFSIIYGTSVIVIFAYAARFLPFVEKLYEEGLSQLETNFEEAAAVVGSTWFQTQRRIVLPLLRSYVLAAWLLAFALCLGEVDASILVCPPGKTTVALKIFGLYHYGFDETLAALCLILAVAALVPAAVLALVAAGRSRQAP